jgi:hypothetical protein
MTKQEHQQVYNRRHRQKKAQIAALCQEIDEGVARLLKLPPCDNCRAGRAALQQWSNTATLDCPHTMERRKLMESLALARAALVQVDH